MTQMVQDEPVGQAENDEELVQTAPAREILCEPSGHGILNSIGTEITDQISGLREPFCVGVRYGQPSTLTSVEGMSFFL